MCRCRGLHHTAPRYLSQEIFHTHFEDSLFFQEVQELPAPRGDISVLFHIEAIQFFIYFSFYFKILLVYTF